MRASWANLVYPVTALLLGLVLCEGCGRTAASEEAMVHRTEPPASSTRQTSRGSRLQAAARETSGRTLEDRLERDTDLACRISFEQTSAAIRNSPPDLDMGAFPPLKLASEDVFMSDCLALPRMVQKCQVFAYVTANYPACIEARRTYDASVREAAASRHASL